MLRVISVVDKNYTAIDRLSRGLAPFMDSIEYFVCDVHPKRPSEQQLANFVRLAQSADVIDAQYYRTMDMLRQRFPWLKDIPTVLTHHNPYAITERDWNDYECVIGINKTILADLKKITTSRVEYIGHAVDPYFWEFNNNYSYNRSVIMVANRIEGKKGILPVALACKDLGVKLRLVGSISDPDYFRQVIATGVVEFSQNIPDEDLRDLYYQSGIHVCNSIDNFESGTLPMLEAIFCGVPVLTRKIGHVPDWAKDEVVIGDYEPEDVKSISNYLEDMFNDKKRLEKMRHEAWFAIKDKIPERRAYSYMKLYRELLGSKPVSVIVPVAGKEEVTRENLQAIANQTYKNIEIVVVDDGDIPQETTVKSIASLLSLPVKYIYTGGMGYNLAKARNLGIINSTSDILVFCDQRMIMRPEAVEVFVSQLNSKTWLFGEKGANKKEFVENFSCLLREDIVTMGMFNERITEYGGMSQEIRSRARRQHFELKYVAEAKADPAGRSGNRVKKKYEIMRMKTLLWKIGLN